MSSDFLPDNIFKINRKTLLDSIIPLAGGMLNNIDLASDVVYVFSAYPRSDGGPELKGSKVKINESEKQIDFSVKIKGYDGKSSYQGLFLGFLIVPKSVAHYSVSGELIIAKVKFFNATGSTKNDNIEYSWHP